MSARAHRLIGWALALVTTLVVVANQRGVGIARDEVVYMQNGARYADWWIGLVMLDHGVGVRSVTQTFGGPNPTDNNREHPPLMKTLFGLSEKLLHRTLGVTGEVTGFRLPSAILHGVLVLLVYLMVLELWGVAHAIVAALLVLCLPRAVFHAGLACFDAPIMTLWFATIYAYWRGLDGRRWPWQVGVAWGLALATKHTALLLPLALGVHYVIVALRARPRGGEGTAGATRRARAVANARAVIGYRWRVIVSLAVLGPVTLYAVWPWLWFDPMHHVRDWLTFHLHHVHYNYEYLGRNWNAPRFPWHVALVTTLFTVPAATLAAAVTGAGVWIAERIRRDPGRSERDLRGPVLLFALSLAASAGPFFLGTTPIFGAEKHWMPVLPTLCIAAAAGVVWAARAAAGYLATFRAVGERLARRLATGVLAGIAGSVVLAAAVETQLAEPYALTWYNALAGGAPGGADLGMNRQFWGVAVRGVLARLAAEARPTGNTYVYTHDASPAWGLYQRLGLVPSTLLDAGWEQAGIDRSELAVVIHERHFNRHDYLIWNSYRTVQPIYVLASDGVPIVSVYRRPAR
ncbi:MAG TPA: glycosyltransferase family 39 protein [Kofleriaceae bacterium]|jgi:4-amino-4-deoxy-L-arabinose transferase-like glycosyltransferase|nr:glycosyltransferase family 39 protein [Kofleriaceae bacterium]